MFRRNRPQSTTDSASGTPGESAKSGREETLDDLPPMPAGLNATPDTPSESNPLMTKTVTPPQPTPAATRPGFTAARAPEAPAPAAAQSSERRLIVGRDIVLSGEVAACDHLLVEGKVEAKVSNAHRLELADCGEVRGEVDIDEADIAGTFDGSLTVNGQLTVRASGRVTGTIRYRQLAVEAGGQLSGAVEVMDGDAPPRRAAAHDGQTEADSRPEGMNGLNGSGHGGGNGHHDESDAAHA